MAARLTTREAAAGTTAVALAGLAVVALLLGFAPFEQRTAWIVVLASWIVGAAGLVGWLRAGARDAGLLLAAAAATSLVGSALPPAQHAFVPEAALTAAAAATLAAGIVVAAAGRRLRPAIVIVAGGALALGLPVGLRVPALASLPILSLAIVRVEGPRVPTWTVVAGCVLLGAGVVPAGLVPGAAEDPRVVLAVASATAATLVAAGLVADADRRRRILDTALEGEDATDPRRAGDTTRRLGALVGDDRLRIGFWRPDEAAFRDAAGATVAARPPALRGTTGEPTWTTLTSDGVPVALVEHPPGLLADEGARAALTRAASLVVARAGLEAEVARQASEIAHSRKRLIAVADEERRQLRAELEDRLAPRLASLEASLGATDGMAVPQSPDPGVPMIGGGPLAQVRAARAEIDAILDGLPPVELGREALTTALRDLAARSPVRTEVEVTASAVPDDVSARTALYFTCAEGLTNVARHAGASSARVTLDGDHDTSRLIVEDDGRGGAVAAGGTGLVGLRDRLDALGGRLAVDSPLGGGTRLIATVPRTRAEAPA